MTPTPAGVVPKAAPCPPTMRARSGRTAIVMTSPYAASPRSVTAAPPMFPVPATAVIAATIIQPAASSKAAHATARVPIGVASRRWSSRIRTSTGKAVMLMAAPMKSANGDIPTPGGAYEYHASAATPLPSTNGTTRLARLVTSARPPMVRRCPTSRRQPTRNMKSTSPIWLIVFKVGSDDPGKSDADNPGASHPKKEGPSRRPTIISAMTAGCRSLANSGVAKRHSVRMTATCSSRRGLGIEGRPSVPRRTLDLDP